MLVVLREKLFKRSTFYELFLKSILQFFYSYCQIESSLRNYTWVYLQVCFYGNLLLPPWNLIFKLLIKTLSLTPYYAGASSCCTPLRCLIFFFTPISEYLNFGRISGFYFRSSEQSVAYKADFWLIFLFFSIANSSYSKISLCAVCKRKELNLYVKLRLRMAIKYTLNSISI